MSFFTNDIAHMALLDDNVSNAEDSFLRTLIDFNLIVDAKESYRFESKHLLSSMFPVTASMCSNKELVVHYFD